MRGGVLVFCWMTALYAFITSSAFAYLQFIKPRVFHWLGWFSDQHWALSWVWLALLVATLWPHLRGRGAARAAARLLAFSAGAAVLWNTMSPVMPALHDGARSVVSGVVALVPVLALGAIDHLAAWSFLRGQRGAHTERELRQREGRLLLASGGTALLLTAVYAVLASVSIGRAFEPDLQAAGLALGVGASLLNHLLVFAAAFVTMAVAARACGDSVTRQYVVLLGAVALLMAGLFARFVGDSVGLTSMAARITAVAFGASVAVALGGARLGAHVRRHRSLTLGLDVLLTPPPMGTPSGRIVIALVAVLPLAWAFVLVANRMDWDFALLKSGVVAVWVLTFALVYRATPLRDVSAAVVLVGCGLPALVHAAWSPTPTQLRVDERYAVHNPSFLLSDGLLREKQRRSLFNRYLRANTGLTDVDVTPVSIDLVPALTPVPPAQRPHIFLLVVDSLRSDYLSPYNAGVHFTPRIAQFADENGVFPNAFTRYGGTGLSMPAIWAGSVIAHKQYVVPFGAMNALQKLVTANNYRRIQSHDHITEALWSDLDHDAVLERGRTEMDFDFCGTVSELGDALAARSDARPIFAQTRSLNLHVASVRNGFVPAGKSYPGFDASYAYRVERIDGCFGGFIDRLKQLGLYDRSLVVLTADHGELIGEDGRWGHSYHMFPQVIQVPLFMHFPRSASTAGIDRGAATYSTDITPTIYAALGYQVQPASTLAGRSVTGDLLDSAARRRTSAVLTASYGAVYAVVSGNGRRLYIADAIQEQEHAYVRSSTSDLRWQEVPVTAAMRFLGRLHIRRQIDTIGRTYGIDREF